MSKTKYTDHTLARKAAMKSKKKDNDALYMELAKDPEANKAELEKMVKDASIDAEKKSDVVFGRKSFQVKYLKTSAEWASEWSKAGGKDSINSIIKDSVISDLKGRSIREGWDWGWGLDEKAKHDFPLVIYFDTPVGQISFHTDYDLKLEELRKFNKPWDGEVGKQYERLKKLEKIPISRHNKKNYKGSESLSLSHNVNKYLSNYVIFNERGEIIPLSERFRTYRRIL